MLEGGTTNFQGRTSTTNGGFYVQGRENLTTVNLSANSTIQGTNTQGAALTVYGSGNNTIDGALLNITAQASVFGNVSVLAGDVRLSGAGNLRTVGAISGLASTAGLATNELVTGPFGSSFVSSVISGSSITLSGSSNASGTQGLTFGYMESQTGTLSGTTSVTGLSSTGFFYVGEPVFGSGIAAGTTIASIVNGTSITLSTAATGSGAQSLNFGAAGYQLGTLAGTTTVTGLATTAGLFVGEPVNYAFGTTVIPAGTTIASIVNGTTITLSQAATATGTAGLSFGSIVSQTGVLAGTTSVTGLASTAALYVGEPVYGTGIPAGTKVASIVSGTAITLSSAATLSGNQSLNFGNAGLETGNIQGGAINISGEGSTVSSTTVTGFGITNDKDNNITNRLNFAAITLNAGRIMLTGNGSGTEVFSETTGSLTIAGGANYISSVKTNAKSNTLTFRDLSGGRPSYSTVVFDSLNGTTTDTGGVIAFSNAPSLDASGILGGWAYRTTSGNGVALYEFATLSGNQVVPYANANYAVNNFTGGQNSNVKMTSSQTINGGTISSLNIQSSSALTLTINQGTTLDIRTGGLLSSLGNHVITGGNIQADNGTNFELITHLPTNQLTINSTIINNGANAVSLVKSGAATLFLTPQSVRTTTYTVGNTTATFTGTATTNGLVVGNTVTGTGIPTGTTIIGINSGNNSITLSAAPTVAGTGANLTFGLFNTYTGKTVISEGSLAINNETDLGANPPVPTPDQLYINGGTLQVNSDLVLNDTNRGITMGTADGSISVASNKTLSINATNPITATLGRLIFSASTGNLGVAVLSGNNNLSGGVETVGNQTATTGQLGSTYTAGNATVTVSTTAGLEVGMAVSGSGIPDGTTVQSINADGIHYVLSQTPTNNGSKTLLTYDGFDALKLTGNNTIGLIRLLGSTLSLQGTNTLTSDIVVGAGLLRLGGDNTFSGVMTIRNGTIRFESSTGIDNPAGYNLAATGGLVDLNGFNTTVSQMSGTGNITNNGASASVFTVNASTSFTFAGSFLSGALGSQLSLVKNGSGVLSLSSTSSSYTGPTIINGGVINASTLDFGSSTSSIGASSNAAANLVLNQGTLRYNGTTDAFTDRSFTLGVGNNAGALVADGSRISQTLTMGFVGLSPAVAFTGVGSRTLTLGGANRGDNQFNLVLGDAAANSDGSANRTSLSKIGSGTWVIGTTNTYSGETVVNAGILAATVDGAFGVKGGGGIIIGGGTNGSAVLGFQNATLDLRNVTYNTVNQIYLAGGTLATTAGNSSWAGDMYVTANSNITVADGSTLTLKGSIGGPGGITQLGNGTVVLSGQSDPTTRNNLTSASPIYTVQAGTLRLDYSTNNTSKLADTATLTLGGSRLGGAVELYGGSHVEIVSSVTLAAGFNEIVQNASNPGTAILRMNAISRQAGGIINFGANNIASTTTGLTNGILGGWATVGRNSWATTAQEIVSTTTTTSSATVTVPTAALASTISVGQVVVGTGIPSGTTVISISGTSVTLSATPTLAATNNLTYSTRDAVGSSNILITSLTNYTNSGAFTPAPTTNDWVTNANIDIVGNSTQTNGTANTLRFNNSSPDSNHTPAAANTTYNVTLSGTNTVQTGGILFTNNMGAHSAVIGSDGTGKLVNGAGAGADLLILQSNAGSGLLDITAVIANGTGGTNGVDKSGVGSLVLTGLNTYTGVNTVNQGMVSVNNLSIVGYATNTVLTAINQSAGNVVTVNASGGTAGLTYGEIVSGTGLPSVSTISSIATVANRNTITVPLVSTPTLSVGLPVFGAGIPAGTTISNINTSTGVVSLSANATTSGTANLSFGGSYIKAINNLTQFTLSNGSVVSLNNSPFTFISTASSPILPGTSSVTAASTTVTLVGGATTDGLLPGQSVSSLDGTIPANDTIVSIIDATHFTLSQAAKSSNANITLIYGSSSTALNSNVVTLTKGATTAGLSPGQSVSSADGTIPANDTILSIVDATHFTLNQPATKDNSSIALVYGSANLVSGSLNATTQSGSILTVPSTIGLTVGQTVSGTGIPAGSYIASITGMNTLLLNNAVTSTGQNNLTFGASGISYLGTTTSGSTTLTLASTAGLTPGEQIIGSGIASGATIASIVDSTHILMSAAATATVAYAANSTSVLASTTSGSTVVTVSSTSGLSPGAQFTGNGIPTGTSILYILDATHIMLSVPATATASNILSFSAALNNTVLSQVSTTSGNTTVTVPSTVGLSVGQPVTGPGIPAGTTVASILDSTHVGLSQAAISTASVSLSFGGAANALGASLNGASNLVFNGGQLQYNGLTTTTDRGFTINVGTGAQFDVGNAYTTLTLGGNITTPTAQDNYSVVKSGAGVLDFFGYITPNSNSYGLTNLTVNDGTLRLESYFNDQFVRNDVGSLTLGGGNLTVVGSAGRATTQNMPGSLVVNSGASVITVTASGNSDTTLNLQDVNNPQSAVWNAGSTLLFVKNDGVSGSANITLSGLFGVDAQVILPRATWTISDDQAQHPGVNYFAFVDVTLKSNGTSYNVLGSDFNGVAAHTIQGNLANWTSTMNVMDGALSPDAFAGNTVASASVNTIRFYNSSYVTPASGTYTVPGASTVTIGSTLTINQGAILQTTHAGNHINSITGGVLTSGLSNTDFNSGLNSTTTSGSATVAVASTANISVGEKVTGTGIPAGATVAGITDATHYTLSANATATGTNSLVYLGTSDLIIHNWDPATALSISSVIADNTTTNRVLNLVQTGNGTTALSGVNTYTGTTFVEGGVLRLDSLTALPSLSHLRLDGGILGLNSGDFTRSLGTGASQVDWSSSSGFAAYTANRNVNLGGTGALVTWGAGGFVLDNDSLLLGAQDANKTVTFVNSIDLGLKSRMVNVTRGNAGVAVDAVLSGTLQGITGSLIKAGYGTLELSAAANTYGGGTVLAEGTLIADNNASLGTGPVGLGTTSDTPYDQEELILNFKGSTFSNALTFGNSNSTGISVFQGTSALATVSSAVSLQRAASSNVFLNTESSTNVTFSGLITGTGGFTLNGGGTITLANASANSYGSLSGASGSGQAATIIRNGTLIVTNNSSLSGSTLQLGDSTYQLGDSTYTYNYSANVDFATAGASLLGVENSYSFIADNRNALGGVFLATGNGTVTGTGSAISGPGAFYNVNAVVGGTNIVTNAFAHSTTLASSFGLNTTIITLGAGSTSSLFVGTQISGAGIAPGTVITQILSSTQFSISQATTADGTTPVTLTYTGLSTRILVKDEVKNPERNGVYQLAQVNADGTMNLVRSSDFSTTANMKYGTQVTVAGGPTATSGTTYFMAAHSVGTVNGTSTDPVYWLQDSSGPSATLTLQPGVTVVTQNIDLYANSFFSNAGINYYTGAASINASSPVTFTGNVTLQNLLSGVQETHNLNLNSSATTATVGNTGFGMVFSGIISEVQGGFAATADQLSVNLSGPGVTTLSGPNTYYGGTNVFSGTLLVNNTTGSGTGHGDVYVGAGAVLAGTGTLAVDAGHNIAIDSSATLATGNPGTSTSGTALKINLGTGSILAIAGTLNLNLFSNSHGANPSSAVDSLVITGSGGVVDLTGTAVDAKSNSLTPGATAATLTVHNVNNLPTTAFNVGDTFQLINWGGVVPTGTFTNLTVVSPGSIYSQDFTDLPALPSNEYWNLENLYTLGSITVAIPEPSRVWLLLLGLLGMGLRRRRRSMW